MPSQTYWLEKPWIMSADYQGRVTVKDYDDVMKVCLEELDKQPVYFLVDLSKLTTLPLAVTKIPSMIKLVRHHNTMAFGWVGANRITRMLIPTMVYKPGKFVETREAALAFLRERIAADQPKIEPSPTPTDDKADSSEAASVG